MYDMGAVARNGLNHSTTIEQRKELIKTAIEQRFAEFTGDEIQYIPGTVNKIDSSTPAIQREFYHFDRTSRGAYTPKGDSAELTTKPMGSSIFKFMHFLPGQ